MYVPQSEISLRSNCGQIRSKLPVFAVDRFTHTTIWVCGKCKMFAISWIDINIILNMNIWSAQQNDNSNERTFNHTNLIISYRFGFFLEFNCEIVDFWFSTNQRSVCLTKMPHLRVLRDHKSDLIRVIMFYYTICIIRNLHCIFSRYDSYHMTLRYDSKHEIFIGWEVCVFSGTNTFDRFTDRKPRRGVSFRSVAFVTASTALCCAADWILKIFWIQHFSVWLVSQWKPIFVATN